MLSNRGLQNSRVFFVQSLAIILVAGILGETAIRLLFRHEYVTPEILKNQSLQYDPAIFARHVFPLREQNVCDLYFNKATHYVNGKGYRGRDFLYAKAQGTIRIIFYGGSSAFDLALSEGQDWPHKVERILHEKGFKNIEVINAGIPGHALFDAVGRLWTEGHLFQPDYVVFYGGWNDLKQFLFEEPLLRQMKPYVREDNPFLVYRNSFDKFFCEHSQLYVRLRDAYYRYRLRVTPEGVLSAKKQEYKITSSALKQYQLNLQIFVDLARNINAVPILVTEARLFKEHNEDNKKRYLRYAYQFFPHQYIYDSFAKIDELIHLVSQEKGVDVIDASRDLTGKIEYFQDHIHLSPKGSDELASIVAEKFMEILGKHTKMDGL